MANETVSQLNRTAVVSAPDLILVTKQDNASNTGYSSVAVPFSSFTGDFPQQVTVGAVGNLFTGGTSLNPIIGINSSPVFNGIVISGSASVNVLSANTIDSGSTNLYNIFQGINTGVQSINADSALNPKNLYTGGTVLNPTINLTGSPTFNSVQVNTYIKDPVNVFAIDMSNRVLLDSSILSSLDWNNRKTYSIGGFLRMDWQFGWLRSGVTGSTISVDWLNRVLFTSNSVRSIDYNLLLLCNSAGNATVDYGNSVLLDVANNNNSINWATRTLYSLSGGNVLSYANGVTPVISNDVVPKSYVDALITGVSGVTAGSNISKTGPSYNPTLSLVASPSINNLTASGTSNFNSLSATTFSASTINSGTTNLYSIFQVLGAGSGVSSVGAVGNLFTGGTASNPTVGINSSPVFNNLTVSGTSSEHIISATTISASTIISGTTNLYNIFETVGGITGVTAGPNITVYGPSANPSISATTTPVGSQNYTPLWQYYQDIPAGASEGNLNSFAISANTLSFSGMSILSTFTTTSSGVANRERFYFGTNGNNTDALIQDSGPLNVANARTTIQIFEVTKIKVRILSETIFNIGSIPSTVKITDMTVAALDVNTFFLTQTGAGLGLVTNCGNGALILNK